jgi:hypothetical protein
MRLHFKVDPEPVNHSGVPVGIYSCRDNRYTWYYDQYIVGDTGVPFVLNERVNFFDGRYVSKSTDQIKVEGNGTVVLHTRWCSAIPIPHYTQHTFKGRDDNGEEITISGPWIRLLSP